MKFVVESEKDSSVNIDFVLPPSLSNGVMQLHCSFRAFWASSKSYWDPNLDSIGFISTGKDSFYLEIMCSVSPYLMPDLYSSEIFCSIRTSDTTATVNPNYYVEIVSTPLNVTFINNGSMEYLSSGHNYTLFPHDSTVQPLANGSESGVPLEIEITGEPFAQILVSFALPSELSHNGFDLISSSYSSTSLYNVWESLFGDPNNYVVCFLSADGEAYFKLGISVAIPFIAHPGDYKGELLCAAEYIGNSLKPYHRKLTNCPSSEYSGLIAE